MAGVLAGGGAEEEALKPLLPGPQPPSSAPLLLDGEPWSASIQWYVPPRRPYTRRELLADRVVNFAGVALALGATPVLGYVSYASGDSVAKQLGFWAHGFGMTTMLACSAFYHYWAWHWEQSYLLLSLDHAGISAMIMGCYVPIMQYCDCYLTLAFVLLLGIGGWVAEAYKHLADAHDKEAGPAGWGVLDVLHVIRYLVMGWACAPSLPYMTSVLPPLAKLLIPCGGVLYCVGLVIFVQGKLEFHLPIWHSFVLVASGCFYAANLLALAGSSAPLP